ncbi:1100_t:CDS:1, partial [Funneliformis geosporum]
LARKESKTECCLSLLDFKEIPSFVFEIVSEIKEPDTSGSRCSNVS